MFAKINSLIALFHNHKQIMNKQKSQIVPVQLVQRDETIPIFANLTLPMIFLKKEPFFIYMLFIISSI